MTPPLRPKKAAEGGSGGDRRGAARLPGEAGASMGRRGPSGGLMDSGLRLRGAPAGLPALSIADNGVPE
jgi:hypothetical protein